MPPKTIPHFFANKPTSLTIFKALRSLINVQGESTMAVASQISFAAQRKFAWVWLYNVTGSNPQGTVQIMLAINKKMDGPPVYRVTQVGKNRWNHLVVVHSLAEAKDPKLAKLVQAAYQYGASN